MKFKSILAAATIIAMFASLAASQGRMQNAKADRGAGMAAKTGNIKAPGLRPHIIALNLSAKQMQRIEVIKQKMRKEIADIIKNTKPGKERKDQVKKVAEKAIDLTIDVLTTEQRIKAMRLEAAEHLLLIGRAKQGAARFGGMGKGRGMGQGMGKWQGQGQGKQLRGYN